MSDKDGEEDGSTKPKTMLITSLIVCAGSTWYAIKHDKEGGLEDVIEILAWGKAGIWFISAVIALYFILKDRGDQAGGDNLK